MTAVKKTCTYGGYENKEEVVAGFSFRSIAQSPSLHLSREQEWIQTQLVLLVEQGHPEAAPGTAAASNTGISP